MPKNVSDLEIVKIHTNMQSHVQYLITVIQITHL